MKYYYDPQSAAIVRIDKGTLKRKEAYVPITNIIISSYMKHINSRRNVISSSI